MTKRNTEPKHGTRAEYVKRGCRCDACREAARLYNKKRKEANPKVRAQALESTRRYAARYPERRKASHDAWCARNPEKRKAGNKRRMERFRLKKYALTAEQHAELMAKQGGVCAVCGSLDSRQLSVDHLHTTGEVRGLLCRRCNLGLGCFGDDPALLEAAMAYLHASVQPPTL